MLFSFIHRDLAAINLSASGMFNFVSKISFRQEINSACLMMPPIGSVLGNFFLIASFFSPIFLLSSSAVVRSIYSRSSGNDFPKQTNDSFALLTISRTQFSRWAMLSIEKFVKFARSQLFYARELIHKRSARVSESAGVWSVKSIPPVEVQQTQVSGWAVQSWLGVESRTWLSAQFERLHLSMCYSYHTSRCFARKNCFSPVPTSASVEWSWIERFSSGKKTIVRIRD